MNIKEAVGDYIAAREVEVDPQWINSAKHGIYSSGTGTSSGAASDVSPSNSALMSFLSARLLPAWPNRLTS